MRPFACRASFAALLLLLAACSGSSADRPRVVVIGIDSADWRLIDPLIAEGRMPNLATLLR